MNNILKNFTSALIMGSLIFNQVNAVLPDDIQTELVAGRCTSVVLASSEDFLQLLPHINTNPIHSLEIRESVLNEQVHTDVLEALREHGTMTELRIENSILNEAAAACLLTLFNSPARSLTSLHLIKAKLVLDGTIYNGQGYRHPENVMQNRRKRRLASRINSPLPPEIFSYPIIEDRLSLQSLEIVGEEFEFPGPYWEACHKLTTLILRGYEARKEFYTEFNITFPAVKRLEITGKNTHPQSPKFPILEQATLNYDSTFGLITIDAQAKETLKTLTIAPDLNKISPSLTLDDVMESFIDDIINYSALDHLTLPLATEFVDWKEFVVSITDPTKRHSGLLEWDKLAIRPIGVGDIFVGLREKRGGVSNRYYWDTHWEDYEDTKADIILQLARLMTTGERPLLTSDEFWEKMDPGLAALLAIKEAYEAREPHHKFDYRAEKMQASIASVAGHVFKGETDHLFTGLPDSRNYFDLTLALANSDIPAASVLNRTYWKTHNLSDYIPVKADWILQHARYWISVHKMKPIDFWSETDDETAILLGIKELYEARFGHKFPYPRFKGNESITDGLEWEVLSIVLQHSRMKKMVEQRTQSKIQDVTGDVGTASGSGNTYEW